MERKTISIMKACELVGVSRRTIYNWLSSGKIEYVRTAGGSVRIFVDTLWRDPNRADRSATDDISRSRAGQVVASTLEAMTTVKEIRRHAGPAIEAP